MDFRLDIVNRCSFKDMNTILFTVLDKYSDLLPASTDAKILLKPNLNSNMNALTGNTTDLRILSVVIQYLKEKGFTNIVIGEGTNSGFYRNKIGVIFRLKVNELAEYYGVNVKDLNYSKPHEIDFTKGIKANIAKDCIESDFLINLPKLKTHFEVGMSVCLKNLMGCLIGQENKKKTHQDLAENILQINDHIKPHLHIVDALIGMEGLGPTRGTPIRLNTIIVGTDPYLIDMVCTKIAGFDYKMVKTLRLAQEKGLLTSDHHRLVDSLDLGKITWSFSPPKAGIFATFIHNPKRQRYFLKIRNTGFFSYLASTQWFGKFLFLTGLRQDVFLQDEMSCEGLSLEEQGCDSCDICQNICPLGLDLPNYLKNIDERCIYCLYCYSVCPKQNIKFHGTLGFFEEQLRQYNTIIRSLYESE